MSDRRRMPPDPAPHMGERMRLPLPFFLLTFRLCLPLDFQISGQLRASPPQTSRQYNPLDSHDGFGIVCGYRSVRVPACRYPLPLKDLTALRRPWNIQPSPTWSLSYRQLLCTASYDVSLIGTRLRQAQGD